MKKPNIQQIVKEEVRNVLNEAAKEVVLSNEILDFL